MDYGLSIVDMIVVFWVIVLFELELSVIQFGVIFIVMFGIFDLWICYIFGALLLEMGIIGVLLMIVMLEIIAYIFQGVSYVFLVIEFIDEDLVGGFIVILVGIGEVQIIFIIELFFLLFFGRFFKFLLEECFLLELVGSQVDSVSEMVNVFFGGVGCDDVKICCENFMVSVVGVLFSEFQFYLVCFELSVVVEGQLNVQFIQLIWVGEVVIGLELDVFCLVEDTNFNDKLDIWGQFLVFCSFFGIVSAANVQKMLILFFYGEVL